MSILEDIATILENLNIEFETGVFSEDPPEEYALIIPIVDKYTHFADNKPQFEIQECRISLFSQGSYTALKNKINKALLEAEIIITDSFYNGFDTDTKHHHYAIEVAKNYEMEE